MGVLLDYLHIISIPCVVMYLRVFLYDHKPTQHSVNKERSAFRLRRHRCLNSIFRVGLLSVIKRTRLECMNNGISVLNSVRGTVYKTEY